MIKLGKLRLENFKSFKSTYQVDFTNAGLFIFDGPNGFGKTTIFDAIEVCFTGKIGRVESTDTKQKNSHLFKYYPDKPTTIFLELKEEEKTKAVIYAFVGSNTSKEENKPNNCNVEIKILSSWPESFSEGAFLDINTEISLSELTGNAELNKTFDLFNYVQQEETCHFLKNKESKRHDKINYLFGTNRQNDEKEHLNVIKRKLTKKLKTVEEEITALEVRRKAFELDIDSELSSSDSQGELTCSGLLASLQSFSGSNVELLERFELSIDDLIWVINNNEEYNKLEFNFLLNLMLENRQQELKDLIMVGHFSSYSHLKKNEKHSRWLELLSRKIEHHRKLISLLPGIDSSLPVSVMDQFIKSNSKIAQSFATKINQYHLSHKEIGGFQEIIKKLAVSRQELRRGFESHIKDKHDIDIPCPFCGDIKNSVDELWEQYEKQTELFESLKSGKLSELEVIEKELNQSFIAQCIQRSQNFINKYERYLSYAVALSEQFITQDRWLSMLKTKRWLEENKISYTGLIRTSRLETIGDLLPEKLGKLCSLLRNATLPLTTDVNVTQIKASFKLHNISYKSSKLINPQGDELNLIALEQDKKYLQALDLKLNSNKLNEIKLKLGRLDKVQGELKSKEQLVRSTYNKFNTNIKDYEKLVAKQIAIPFYIYSSKILQTRPDGNGAFIKSADTTRENGYIRFVSNLYDDHDAWNTMSSGQLSGLVISFMLAMNKVYPTKLKSLLIDDPVQTMDEINLASFVQLLRKEFADKQLIISTHERKSANFFAYKYQHQTNVEVFNMKQERLSV